MDNFVFYSPTMFAFGDGEEKKTGALVKQFGGSKVLLVYGGGSVKRNGAYDAVTASLKEAGIEWVELSGIQANPRSGNVYEGIDICRKEGVDFLLALGGGSVIDTAKAIGVGADYDGDFWDFFTGKTPATHTLPVGTVLTISAAGSEGSDSMVITHENGNLKWGAPKTDVIRPKFSVLNPRYTCSLPLYQIASGAVDMFAHICERYFSNTPDVELTDRLAEALMKTIVDAAPKAIADTDDYKSHADLMWAGMLAHNNTCGVGRAQDWASHQIEHELSGQYDRVSHGAGLAVIFPAWCRYVWKEEPERFVRFAEKIWGVDTKGMTQEEAVFAGIECCEDYFRSLGMPVRLSEMDIDDTHLHEMAVKGTYFGKRTLGGFKVLDEADIEAIYRIALK